MDDRLRSLAVRAAELIKDLEPPEVRGPLAAEVFRAMRLLQPEAGASPRPEERVATSARAEEGWPETLGEYLAELGDISHPVRLTAIAAFRLRRDGVDGLTGDDFMNAYADVRTPRPQNLSVNVGRASQRGWLVPTRDGRRGWRVTQRGLAMLSAAREGLTHE